MGCSAGAGLDIRVCSCSPVVPSRPALPRAVLVRVRHGVPVAPDAEQGRCRHRDRHQARLRLLQAAHGGQQAPRRRARVRAEVPGALQAALLHAPRQVCGRDSWPLPLSRLRDRAHSPLPESHVLPSVRPPRVG